MTQRLKQRMYGLVPYNISPIQQGIQFGHAVVEYGLEHGESDGYLGWAHEDKTFIILNGGTTSTNPETPGTLNQALEQIDAMGLDYATFHEPDLGDQLTAVVFLVDERVWDLAKWPDSSRWYTDSDTATTDPVALVFKEDYMRTHGDDAPQIAKLQQWLNGFRLA